LFAIQSSNVNGSVITPPPQRLHIMIYDSHLQWSEHDSPMLPVSHLIVFHHKHLLHSQSELTIELQVGWVE
jgi:hypothetical protein